MDAVKIPLRSRLLLVGPRHPLSPKPLFQRWAGQLPPGGVLTETGVAGGWCGHTSVFRWRIRRHTHPGDRPVPADLQAALRGEAPVPDWFRGE